MLAVGAVLAQRSEESITPEGQPRARAQAGREQGMVATWHGVPKPEQGEAVSHPGESSQWVETAPHQRTQGCLEKQRIPELGQAGTR